MYYDPYTSHICWGCTTPNVHDQPISWDFSLGSKVWHHRYGCGAVCQGTRRNVSIGRSALLKTSEDVDTKTRKTWEYAIGIYVQ